MANVKDDYAQRLHSVLPDRGDGINSYQHTMAESENVANEERKKATARELIELKRKKAKQLDKVEKYSDEAKELEADIAVIEELENENNGAARQLVEGHTPDTQYAREVKILSENVRPEISKLMHNLGINLNLSLSKSDTMNLLAALLTCNESQLEAIAANPKVPLAIKTVIRRLQNDAKLGNIESIERLWDRVFGKTDKTMLMAQPAQVGGEGIIPNTPVSREAYLILKETLTV